MGGYGNNNNSNNIMSNGYGKSNDVYANQNPPMNNNN